MKYDTLSGKIIEVLDEYDSEDDRIPEEKRDEGFMAETEVATILEEDYDLGYKHYQPMINKVCRRMEEDGLVVIEKVSGGPGPSGMNIVRKK